MRWSTAALLAVPVLAIAVVAGRHTLPALFTANHAAAADSLPPLADEGPMPSLSGGTAWLNSAPLTRDSLRGKVVLVDFWTYSCVNCLRALPYIKAWDAKYRADGLVVIGVHAPEFEFEHDSANVRASLDKLGITYPVVMDNDMAIWNAFHNQYWPAHYFIDVNGRIRHHHFGEGQYAESEAVIRALLRDVPQSTTASAKQKPATKDTSAMVTGTGALAAADFKHLQSPETYLGYHRADRFAANEAQVHDQPATYSTRNDIPLNQWGLHGAWTVHREYIEPAARGAAITYHFQARDVNLVLGPATRGTTIRFHVTIDGHAPGADAGVDVDANGNGTVDGDRMYQLIRQRGDVKAHVFTITFDEPGVQAYAFTFG
jgi:thiol-disulfide isomerase/thioredoxin